MSCQKAKDASEFISEGVVVQSCVTCRNKEHFVLAQIISGAYKRKRR